METKEEVKFGGAAMSLPVELSCLQGGAEGEAALATLEKQLICPICLELFNKPVVILPCQHNLCRKCANELYQPSLFQARTTMQVNSGRFRCPSCRHEVVLDRHGVYGLQRNLLVENIIDIYKQEVINSSNATSSAPPPPPPAPQVTCSDHEGEKVNIYCLTCQRPTCSLCKVFGAHQSCQVAPLTDVYQQQKDELSEGVRSLVAVNDKVQGLIDELEETCRNIEENCKTQKQNVCEKFSRVFSVLEERQKVMMQRITTEQEEKTGHTQALVRCYGDSVAANNKLMESAKSSMEEPDMAAFVQNSREQITKVITASTSGPSETLIPGYESLSHYRFNFSREERALRSIDFLKVVEDVPEEPELEPEPEEPKEPLVQSIEPKHLLEPSAQNLDSDVEPVKEELIPTSVEPAAPTPVPPAPGPGPDLMRDSVEPAGAETGDPEDFNNGRPGLMKNKEEEEEEEEEEEDEEEEEEEGCAAPDPVKEGTVCEEQEGMSTQQCEAAGEAEREMEDEHDAQDEEEEEEEKQVMKEDTDTLFYPGWYKPNSRCRVTDVLPKVCDAERTMCPEAEIQTDEYPIQEQSPSYPDQPPPGPQQYPHYTELHTLLPLPQLPHKSETQPPPLLQKSPVELGGASTPVGCGAGITEEEDEEEEDMQGWVCLVEGSFDLGDGFSDNNESPSSEPARSGVDRSDMDEENFEGRVEEAAEKHDKDVECASELKVSGEGEIVDEEQEEGRKEKMDDDDDGMKSTGSLGDVEFEADGEKTESEEKISSSMSLQAVTLLFYLLAFLVLLQRVWAYIGCFICT